MSDQGTNKPITLDDLAMMMAKGFENTATKQDIEVLTGRMDKLDGRMDKLDGEMQALSSKVTNYLELSDKRYIELKRRDIIIARWIKLVADKTGVPVDLAELEKL